MGGFEGLPSTHPAGRDKPKPDQQVLDPSADDQLHFYRKALRRVLPPIPGNAMASVLPSTPLSCAYQSAAVEPKDEAPVGGRVRRLFGV